MSLPPIDKMIQENIDIIQNPPDTKGSPAPVPLVLFHDGGGTVFNYYMLGDLKRPVYAISNPHYAKDTVFEGGMPEMARHYVGLMKKYVPRGKILIGGWSLGGLTSIEVARMLADDKDKDCYFQVLGIVMLDSVCPHAYRSQSAAILKIVPHVVEWNASTKEATKQAVLKCFADATAMVINWEMPSWEEGVKPPPVILLKAKDPVPVLENGGVSRVDVVRNDQKLGWGLYRDDLITQVIAIPGHHYNIFNTEWRQENITKKISQACQDLEKMARDKSQAVNNGA